MCKEQEGIIKGGGIMLRMIRKNRRAVVWVIVTAMVLAMVVPLFVGAI